MNTTHQFQPGDIFYQPCDPDEGLYGDCYPTRAEAEQDQAAKAGAPVIAFRVHSLDEYGDIDGFCELCPVCGIDHADHCRE